MADKLKSTSNGGILGSMTWPILYLAAILAANYTATWFIPLPVFGLVAVGTLIFGVTFTARDHVHRQGRLRVYLMILISALAAAGLSALGAVPARIILASVTAIILAEAADTEVYQRLLARRWLVRVAGSNLVSIPLDSTLFNLIAFLGVFALPMLIAIIWGEIVTKFLTGAIIAFIRSDEKDSTLLHPQVHSARRSTH